MSGQTRRTDVTGQAGVTGQADVKDQAAVKGKTSVKGQAGVRGKTSAKGEPAVKGQTGATGRTPVTAQTRVADIDALCSGLFSDVLDGLGYREQVIGGLRPNAPGLKFFGHARTLRLETVETPDERIAVGLGFLGQLGRRDVLVVEGSREFAYFGELMTRLSLRQQLAGVVIGGLTRDLAFTRTAPLPIHAEGFSPRDIKGRGRVAATDVRVTLGGVDVRPGDLLFGDDDGVVVIPRQLEQPVLAGVREKLSEEERIIRLIDEGISVSELLETVREF